MREGREGREGAEGGGCSLVVNGVVMTLAYVRDGDCGGKDLGEG